MELHQIRYFLALCEELNFTRAAERSGVAQSSLTRAIKALETELGGPLFHRERANTHLSKLGEKVRPFLDQAHRYVEDATRQAQDFMRAQAMVLRLGIMWDIPPALMRDLVSGFRQRHPGITLQIADAGAAELQRRLLASELDVAIYASPALGGDQRFSYLPLYREPFAVVVASGHPFVRRDRVRVRDLAGEPMLRRADCDFVDELLARSGGPVVYESDRDDWIVAMAAAGLGYAVLPAFGVTESGIAVCRMTEPEIVREVALVTVHGRTEPLGLGALVREAMRMRWPGVAAAERDLETSTSAR